MTGYSQPAALKNEDGIHFLTYFELTLFEQFDPETYSNTLYMKIYFTVLKNSKSVAKMGMISSLVAVLECDILPNRPLQIQLQ